MTRIHEERDYWEKASRDPDVDRKYISDITEGFDEPLSPLHGKTLEIGCGVGRLMRKGYYGIDISPGMIEIAKHRRPDCHFKVSDGRTIPYEDEFFDSVYSVLVFQHLPLDAVQGYIKEVRRVLRRHGVFIYQFIEGVENAPFSKHHTAGDLMPKGFVWKKERGIIHPQWTWVTGFKT